MNLELTALAAMLAAAAWSDHRSRRIPNALVLAGFATGTALALLNKGLPGLGDALLAAGIGLIALLPFFVLRMVGAGDVKLMAAVGTFTGTALILPALLYTLIAGGVIALAALLLHRRGREAFDNVKAAALWLGAAPRDASQTLTALGRQSVLRIPYAWAIAAGTLTALVRH